MSDKEKNFLECPDCGNDQYYVEAVPIYRFLHGDLWYVRCNNCGEFEPFKTWSCCRPEEVTAKAIEIWNNTVKAKLAACDMPQELHHDSKEESTA